MSFFPVNTGGKLFAAICVTYPAGSTCTCTGNGRTWTAKNTSGRFVFAVPATGTWTVKATNGTETATQSVNITIEGQGVVVNLSYGLKLYANGVDNNSVTGGWTATGNNVSASNISDNGSTLIFTHTANGVSDNGQWYFGTSKKINLSDYSVLRVTIDSITATSNNYIGVCSAQTYGSILDGGYKAVSGAGTYELDISSYDGEYYVGFGSYQNTNTNQSYVFSLFELTK